MERIAILLIKMMHRVVYREACTRAPAKVPTVRDVLNCVWSKYNNINPEMLAKKYKHRLYLECNSALTQWLGGHEPDTLKFATECTNMMLSKWGGHLKKSEQYLDATKEQALKIIQDSSITVRTAGDNYAKPLDSDDKGIFDYKE